MAASKNVPLELETGDRNVIPVAAGQQLFQGSLVFADAAGRATAVLGAKFLGHAAAEADNRNGGAGAISVWLHSGRYRAQVTLASVALTSPGKQVFASDSNTLALTSNGNANTLVGLVIRYVTTNIAVVEFLTVQEVEGGGRLDFETLVPGTETNGSLMTTGITWVPFTAPGACGMKLLLANAAASGDFATLRMRARSDAAGPTVCGNFSASAGVDNHGNLYAVQGYAQPNAYTQNSVANIVCGLYSCIDATGASVGRRWSAWFDDHSTVKASGGHYLVRLSQNGSAIIDGAITVYPARLPHLFNIEEAGGFLSAASIAISVMTPDGQKFIRLYGTAS